MQPTIQYIRNELQSHYPADEVEAMTRIIFEYVCQYTLTDLTLRRQERLPEKTSEAIKSIVERLKKHEPIQYITGSAEFLGLTLSVSPAVLIPRPETEELAQWIVSCEQLTGNALDIATGSGCLALALKYHFPQASIWGCDISHEALAVAGANAQLNHLEAEFFQSDILAWKQYEFWLKYDLIVSNPPYVAVSEQKQMQSNVLQYEPWKALFVADENPLLFYENIAQFAINHLSDEGVLYFEINERFARETANLLKEIGFMEVTIKQDMQKKDRMVRAKPRSTQP